MNYYELLEVSQNASVEVIRAAYKSLMQRYHPDKNPGDAAVADRASLVVQAYEVLSDAGKRSAYDLKLKKAPDSRHHPFRDKVRGRPAAAASARKVAEKDSRVFWLLCLLIAVIIGSGLAIASLLKKRLAPAAEQKEIRLAPKGTPSTQAERPDNAARIDETPRESPAVAGREAADSAKDPAAREIPALLTRLSVTLNNHDRPAEERAHVLFIPLLGVRVGALDAESAIRHLNNTADLLGQKLQEKLADAKFDELIKKDGEQYLARMILDTIGEASGTTRFSNAPLSNPDSPNRYGVVEVLLPQSFSVK